MSLPQLVISNPPHGAVDTRRAAPVLNLLPVEVGLKAGYGIPEIWLALPDASGPAAELAGAGLNVTILPAEEFRDLPAQQPLDGFGFEGTKLVVEQDGAESVITPDLPVVAVACTPTGQGEGTGASGAFVDLYIHLDGVLRRYGVVQGVTDFSGLAGVAMLSATARLAKFVTECEARLTRAVVDHRLMHLQVRRRVATPPPGQPQRKGFSYASPGFRELMTQLSPNLADLSQPEVCSRLVYLTRRDEGA